MAGAGYKLFNTGDVLTAAQVNTYLMEQTVMVFANAAARTTALSGVVSEGMISYLKDTNAVEVYDGSNWVSSDDPNAIQNSIIAAKGDLIAGSANDTPAILSVGSNGDTLVADSAATTGLRWQGNYSAGKNKIINGDCAINQRGFTSGTTQGQFVVDRFQDDGNGGTITSSVQQFTPGTAPVAGYEAKQFMRTVTVSQSASTNYQAFNQAIEDVRTLAGQTVTVSFWAKAASGTPNIGVALNQNFGSGGSSAVITSAAVKTITTSWARYSFTVNLPSVAGKTIGTSSFVRLYIFVSIGSSIAAFGYPDVGLQNNTFDVWGVQVEAGNVATAFQTATGTIQGELAACQRYYYRAVAGGPYGHLAFGNASSASAVTAGLFYPVTMRTSPTSIDNIAVGSLRLSDEVSTSTFTTITLNTNGTGTTEGVVEITGAGSLTTGRMYKLQGNNVSTAYIGFSAEL
jgi:hypothetical protein